MYVSTYLFARENATSCVMLSGRVTPKVFLTRSLQQGCPLSPLLFAIVTHPLLVILSNLTARVILWVCIFLLAAQALVDDSFMFLQAKEENLERSTQVWD